MNLPAIFKLTTPSMHCPQLNPLETAIIRLAAKLRVVNSEHVAIEQIHGRILAEDLRTDRDSPALDVSAMDGYAVRIGDVCSTPLPIQAITAAGSAPTTLLPGHAIRIFTGAPVPQAADCVVRREDTEVMDQCVKFSVPAASLLMGQNIRRQGENARRGTNVLPAGTKIDAATVGAMASFGGREVSVRRKLRVAILNTGDEIFAPGTTVADWQIRDSNGPTLSAWFASMPWVEVIARQCIDDSLASVREAMRQQIADCDAIFLTGGVSMGDADYVPAAIDALGGETVFHRLPLRPGKPVLGACLDGKLLLGLPGNPVSVAVTSRVFGAPLLHALTGCSTPPPRPLVTLSNVDDNRLDLVWYRLVHINAAGAIELVATQGSGDIVSLSHSCGFVEVPAGMSSEGALRLTLW